MKISTLQPLATAALLACLAAGSLAQTPPPPAGLGGGNPNFEQRHRGGERPQLADPSERRARMQEHFAQKMAALKQKLGITAAQEGAWTTWTTAMQPPANRPQRPDRAEFERLTTPERIDRMRAHRAERQAAHDKRGDATKAFYAALNAEQKKVFDAESLRFGKGGKGGHGGGHGRHHRG